MSYFSKRALRWAAPVALVGALGLAACGNSDDTEAVRVAAPGVAAFDSEQHLANELAGASASAGSDQDPNNQAAELARQARAYQAASARLTAQAEQYERAADAGYRAAQMAQAESYVQQQQERAELNSVEGIDPDAVRASNADSSPESGPDDEFLPGSRHVPTR
jgi:hypothetical protein